MLNDVEMALHMGDLFGRHEWPKGAQLALSWRTPAGNLATEWAPASDIDAAIAKLARRAETTDTYIGCAVRRHRPESGRGKRTVCLPLSALWVDLDTDDGVHKVKEGERHPTRAEADEMIAACPLAPQLIVHSGGGYQLWWLLEELLDTSDEAQFALMKRMKTWWVQEARRRGVKLDEGVIADPARILRSAGSLNHKSTEPRPVRLVGTNNAAPYTHADLDQALPPLEETRRRKRTVAKKQRTAPAERGALTEVPDEDNPYRRFSLQYPVGRMLVDLELAEPLNGDVEGESRWDFEAGDDAYTDHASTYIEPGEPQTLTIFDIAAQGEFGLEDHAHAIDGYELLKLWVCDGNGRIARRIAELYDQHPDLLSARLQEYPGRGEFAAFIPDPRFELDRGDKHIVPSTADKLAA